MGPDFSEKNKIKTNKQTNKQNRKQCSFIMQVICKKCEGNRKYSVVQKF